MNIEALQVEATRLRGMARNYRESAGYADSSQARRRDEETAAEYERQAAELERQAAEQAGQEG